MEVRILGTIIREVDDDILPSSTWTFPLKFNPFQNVTAPSEGKKRKENGIPRNMSNKEKNLSI